MKNLFLSWSGNRSLMMAEALRDWLPLVIPSIDPWLSVADIDRGKGWIEQLAEQLQQQRIGVICLTSDNLTSPWLFFEAGAVSKLIGESLVYAYLLDIQPIDLQPSPFTQLEMSIANREDTRALLLTINKALGVKGISPTVLDQQFAMSWPLLEEKLANIPPKDESIVEKRTDRDLLEELLQITKSLGRDIEVLTQIEKIDKIEEMDRQIRELTSKISRLEHLMDLIALIMDKVLDKLGDDDKKPLDFLHSEIQSTISEDVKEWHTGMDGSVPHS